MKRWSTYVFKELQIKTMVIYTMYLSEWLTSKTLTMPNAKEYVEQQELSFITGGNSK